MRTPLLVTLVAAAAALGITGVAIREQPPPEHLAVGRPVQQHEDGFVSSNTCHACHPNQYSSWHASYHRTMTQTATPDTAVANFNDVTIAAVHGRPMRLTQRGQQLWAEFDDPDSRRSSRASSARSR